MLCFYRTRVKKKKERVFLLSFLRQTRRLNRRLDNLRQLIGLLVHLAQLFAFGVGQGMVQLLEPGVVGYTVEEVDEVLLRRVVGLVRVPFAFVHVAHQICKDDHR